MPVDFNGTIYRLAFLDTNVISEVSKRREPERSALIELLTSERIAPCYSKSSIIEIMESPGLFKSYIECFGILPSVIVRDYDQLAEEEVKAYPNPRIVDPVICSVWGLRDQHIRDPREKLKKLIELSGIEGQRATWRSDKHSILDGMLSLVKNYPPSGARYTKRETYEFVERANRQHLNLRFPGFIRSIESKGQDFEINAFPSLKMRAYSTFYRFYADKHRKPTVSDVSDVLMSSILPYVDVAYLENYQAEIVRQTMRVDPFISALEVRTLSDLRPRTK